LLGICFTLFSGGIVNNDGKFQALIEEANPSIDLTQTLFSVDIVPVFRPVAIGGGPVDNLDNLRPIKVRISIAIDAPLRST